MSARVIYLHGFASSPRSFKAGRFAAALRARGIDVVVPDLNEGDFSGLTISRQLRLIERLARERPGPLILIGSSFGGYTAALFAATCERVVALVLMAPAFDFHSRWIAKLGAEELERWRERGSIPLHHYGSGREEQIGYGLIEDAAAHPPYPELTAPTLIFHGRQDEAVDCEVSERFSAGRGNVTLELLDSDHKLGDAIDRIIERSLAFLEPRCSG